MKYTADQRVQNGLDYLDRAAQHNKITKYWRNLINKEELRIDNCDKSVPAQICGDWSRAKKVLNIFGYYAGSDKGFQHYPRPYRDSSKLLKEAWNKVLTTDKLWTFDRVFNCHKRVINGVHYFVFPYFSSSKCNLRYKLGGQNYSTEYKDVESAKRAVRKLAVRRT